MHAGEKSQIRVLTDHGRADVFAGIRRRILAPPGGGGALAEVFWGLKCWIVSIISRRDLPIVTVGHGHGLIFAYLQYCFRWLFPRRTHVMFDLLLDHQAERGWARLYERFKTRVFNRVVDLAVVWGAADVERYARAHGLDRARLRFHPFHTTLAGYAFEIRDDGYIFAGGNAARDYATLIEALREIDYPVLIATTRPEIAPLAQDCPHITVRGLTPAEFRAKMAGATLVVECHDERFFRTGGHQTFLNAFWMGKPFVMADRESAVGYFEDGEFGFVVDHGDIAGFRARVRELLADPQLRAEMGRRAQAYARRPIFEPAVSMQSIYNLAIEIDAGRRGYDGGARLIYTYGNGTGPDGLRMISS